MDSLKLLQDPAQGRVTRGFVLLVKDGLVCQRQLMPELALAKGIDQKGQSHDQG